MFFLGYVYGHATSSMGEKALQCYIVPIEYYPVYITYSTETRRNDPRMQRCLLGQLHSFRSNVDATIPNSQRACIRYVTKYVTKKEQQIINQARTLTQILHRGGRNQSVNRTVQKLLNKTLADRDISSQENMHYVLGLPLTTCTRVFEHIILSYDPANPESEREIQVDPESGSTCLKNGPIDIYGHRHLNRFRHHTMYNMGC